MAGYRADRGWSLLNAGSFYPEAFFPGGPRRQHLLCRIFAVVRHVGAVRNGRHGFKANVLLVRGGVDDSDDPFGAVHDFDLAAFAFEREGGFAIGIADQVRVAVIDGAGGAEGRRVRQIVGFHFAGGDEFVIGDDGCLGRDVCRCFVTGHVRQHVVGVVTDGQRHRLSALVEDGGDDFELPTGELVSHLVFVGKGPVGHQVGVLPEFET